MPFTTLMLTNEAVADLFFMLIPFLVYFILSMIETKKILWTSIFLTLLSISILYVLRCLILPFFGLGC